MTAPSIPPAPESLVSRLIPGLSNAKTTDALHLAGLAVLAGAGAIALFTAAWSYFHPTLAARIPPVPIIGLGGLMVAGGITNSKLAPDEGRP